MSDKSITHKGGVWSHPKDKGGPKATKYLLKDYFSVIRFTYYQDQQNLHILDLPFLFQMKFAPVVAILLLVALISSAQRREVIHLSKYGQKDGLPSYNVHKVMQDTKGFIWLATQDGISRFDGRSFLNYSKSSARKHKICGVDAREIIEDTARGLLWVLPGEIGINAISSTTGEVVLTVRSPDSTDWNLSMIKDEDILWIGTATGVKTYNISKKKYETGLTLPKAPDSVTNFETRSLLKDEYGNIWACYSGYGIVIYDRQTKKIVKEIPLDSLNDHTKSRDIRFYSAAIVRPGDILFATSQGLRRISYSKNYMLAIDNAPCKSNTEFNIANTENASLYQQNKILVAGDGKFCEFDLLLEKYSIIEEPAKLAETNWLSAVQYSYTDHENNLWLGCQEGLAFISRHPSPFTSYNYDRITNTTLEHLRSIFVMDNGDILAGLRNGIVEIKYSRKPFIKYDTSNLYHHIFQDKKGLIHVSTPDGMFIYTKGKLVSVATAYSEFTPYASFPVNSHLFINDTMIILGTENNRGVLIWNPAKKTVKSINGADNKSILPSGIVNNIYEDSRKNIWVLSDNLISILNPDITKSKKLVLLEKESGFLYKLFFDVCEANGDYWIASYGSGLLQLDSGFHIKKVFTTKEGLCNDAVYQVYNIDNKSILVTSNNGLSVIDLSSSKIKNYFAKDGLQSNSFEEVAGLMKNGKIYTGGMNGFTVIDPKHFSKNTTAPVLYLTNIQIKATSGDLDTSNILLKSINIPNDVQQTIITFSALNYFNPEGTTLRYKIKERQSDWISIGNTNSLPLMAFSHGTYHLQIQASNEDGVASEIQELTLTFLPKWYETWQFKLLLVVLAMGCIYGLYYIRISQLKKEQQIRTRLASDLHDDLGSTMNSVKVYANLALMEKNDKYILKIKESTQEAITGIKDMIWILDDKKDSIEHLLTRVSLFAAPLCEANNMHYKSDITDDARDHKLGQEEKRNLYMMLKEAVNNAVKYSEGQKIEIAVAVKKKKPEISIKDNGKGFDIKKVAEGNGLKNMERRAREIKYYFQIVSETDNGTSIYFAKI